MIINHNNFNINNNNENNNNNNNNKNIQNEQELKKKIYENKQNFRSNVFFLKLKNRSKYELMYESFYIYNLFYQMYNTNQNINDNFFYLIDKNWFNKWKIYVNFNEFSEKVQIYKKINLLPERPYDEQENYFNNFDSKNKLKIKKYFDFKFKEHPSHFLFPGFPNNLNLIIDPEEFKLGKFSLLTDESFENKNYIILNKEIWNFFSLIYGGKTLKVRNIGISCENNKKIIKLETYFRKTNVSLLQFNKNLHKKFFLSNSHFTFFPNSFNIINIKDKILKIKEFSNKIKKFRIWILLKSFSFLDLFDYLENKIKENVFPISFPGYLLEDILKNNTLETIPYKFFIENKNIIIEQKNFFIKGYLFKKQKEYNENDFLGNKNILMYDEIKINCNDDNNNNNNIFNQPFRIRKYFYDKYSLNNINSYIINRKYFEYMQNFIINDEKKQNEYNSQFLKEINELYQNFDLITNDGEILKKTDLFTPDLQNKIELNQKNNEIFIKKSKRTIEEILTERKAKKEYDRLFNVTSPEIIVLTESEDEK